MSKLLFVVHRYAPYPGGSEYFTRDMAEECLKRGHDVSVLAHVHQGDYNSVKVSNDYNILLNQNWDLIIVHGGDVISQNIVHQNAYQINKKNRVAYMIIKPSDSIFCLNGLKHHKFITYSTSQDIEYIKRHNCLDKARRIRHGIVPKNVIKENKIYSVDSPFVSVGGFYPHKAMIELATAWENSDISSELHLYGYGEGQLPQITDRVKVFFGKSQDDVLQAIANAKGYIMNSYEEGFGLVLLEAMMNKTQWFARNIAAAKDLSKFGLGLTYNNENELIDMIKKFSQNIEDYDDNIQNSYKYAMANHTIVNTVNDIEDIIME